MECHIAPNTVLGVRDPEINNAMQPLLVAVSSGYMTNTPKLSGLGQKPWFSVLWGQLASFSELTVCGQVGGCRCQGFSAVGEGGSCF